MQRIHYSSGSMLTGDEIARAVLAYAEVLGSHGRADVVQLPVLLEDGSTGSALMLLGPASQIASIPEPRDGNELRDEALISDLRQRARAFESGEHWSPQFTETVALEDYE
jgi:hypothetical protein